MTIAAIWVLSLQLLLSPIPLERTAEWAAHHAEPIVAAAYRNVVDRVLASGDGPSHQINSVIGYGVVREVSGTSSLSASPITRERAEVETEPASVSVVDVNTETIAGSRITIVDGDTIALSCAAALPGCAEKICLSGIDTPETFEPSCEAERAAGLKAKARLATLVRSGEVSVSRRGKDRYGRTLADVRSDGRDAGATLVSEGLALPYEPGARAKAGRIAHWCGTGNR